MVGIASRYFAGRVALALVAAVLLGLSTGIDADGNVAMFGTIVLGTGAVAFALLAALALSVGDDDSTDRERLHRHPATPAYWPAMSAIGLGVLMVGLVIDGALTILGTGILLVAAVEWTFHAWSDRLSTDAVANETARDRILAPFEIPLYGALAIAVPVFLGSRVLLAVSRNGASWIAVAASTVVIIFAFLIYLKPDIRKPIIATGLALGGLAVIAGGIIGAVAGERDFETHHEETPLGEGHSEDEAPAEGDSHEEGLGAPVVVR
jgi:hypothetical protein